VTEAKIKNSTRSVWTRKRSHVDLNEPHYDSRTRACWVFYGPQRFIVMSVGPVWAKEMRGCPKDAPHGHHHGRQRPWRFPGGFRAQPARAGTEASGTSSAPVYDGHRGALHLRLFSENWSRDRDEVQLLCPASQIL
jgi:hypothetical protein